MDIYVENHLYDEALTKLAEAERQRRDDTLLIFGTGLVYAAEGRRLEALEIVRQLEGMSSTDAGQAEWIAKIYGVLGDREKANGWLECGLETGAIGAFYKDEPVWDSVRDTPRFATTLRRMGVPQ